jgi:hypothetical protein
MCRSRTSPSRATKLTLLVARKFSMRRICYDRNAWSAANMSRNICILSSGAFQSSRCYNSDTYRHFILGRLVPPAQWYASLGFCVSSLMSIGPLRRLPASERHCIERCEHRELAMHVARLFTIRQPSSKASCGDAHARPVTFDALSTRRPG